MLEAMRAMKTMTMMRMKMRSRREWHQTCVVSVELAKMELMTMTVKQ